MVRFRPRRPSRRRTLRVAEASLRARAIKASRRLVQRKKRRQRMWDVLSEREAIVIYQSQQAHVHRSFTADEAEEFWSEQEGMPAAELPWPHTKEPTVQSLTAVYPNIKASSINRLRQGLHVCFIEMRPWGPIATVRCQPPPKALPRLLDVVMDDYALSTTPSHLLCLYPPRFMSTGQSGEPRTMVVIPVHHVTRIDWPATERHVGAAVGPQHIPAESLSPAITATATTLGLRPVPLCVPDPTGVEPLLHFMYTGSVFALFKAHLPRLSVSPPDTVPGVARKVDKTASWLAVFEQTGWIASAASELAMSAQPPEVRGFLRKIWRAHWNVVALGVSDVQMQRTLNACWRVAQLARGLQACGVMVPPPTGEPMLFPEWKDVDPHGQAYAAMMRGIDESIQATNRDRSLTRS